MQLKAEIKAFMSKWFVGPTGAWISWFVLINKSGNSTENPGNRWQKIRDFIDSDHFGSS